MPVEIVLTLITAFIFGTTPLFERWLLHGSEFPLSVGIFARSLPATVAATLFLLLSGDMSKFSSMGIKQYGGFGILGILGSLVGPYLLFIAYRQPQGNISLIAPLLGMFPLFSVLAGTLILGEALSKVQMLGIIMILCGGLLVSWR